VPAILTPDKKFDFRSKRHRPGVDFSGAETQEDEIIGERGFSSLFRQPRYEPTKEMLHHRLAWPEKRMHHRSKLS